MNNGWRAGKMTRRDEGIPAYGKYGRAINNRPYSRGIGSFMNEVAVDAH